MPTHVNRAQNVVTSNQLHTASTAAVPHTAGNLLVVYASYQPDQGASSCTITDLAGNLFVPVVLGTNGYNYPQFWYAQNCLGHAANVVTITLDGVKTSGYLTISVRQFSGIHLTHPLTGINQGQGGSPGAASTGIVPIATGRQCVLVGGVVGNPQITPGAGFTLDAFGTGSAAGAYFADEYKFVTAAEAVTATTAGTWGIVAATFVEPYTLPSVPNVVGQTQAAAESAITAVGLASGVTTAWHATIPSGTVISQTPTAGSAAHTGSSVVLTVSKGPIPATGISFLTKVSIVAQTPQGGTSTPINTTGANLIVVSLSWFNTNGTTQFRDSKGNIWRILSPTVYATSSHCFLYCLKGIVGTDHTFEMFGTADTYPGCHIYVFAGAGSYQTGRGAGWDSSTLPHSGFVGTVMPALDGCLILTGLASSTNASVTTVEPGFGPVDTIPRTATQRQADAAWQIQATAAAINPKWTHTTGPGRNSVANVAIFLPAVKVTPIPGQVLCHGFLTGCSESQGAGGAGQTDPLDTTGANLLTIWTAGWINWGTPNDSYGNVWAPLTQRNSGNNGGRFWYCTAPVVGPNHTFGLAGASYPAWVVHAFSGVNVLQVEVGATITTVVQPVLSGGVTPVANGALVLSGFMSSGEQALSCAPGFKVVQIVGTSSGSMKAAAGYLIQPVAGAVNPAWSWTVGSSSNAVLSSVVFTAGLPTAEARLHQLPVEVLTGIDPATVQARLHQLPLEVLLGAVAPTAKLSQVALEVLLKDETLPSVKLSQVALEVLIGTPVDIHARLSQVGLEVLYLPQAIGGDTVMTIWLGDGGGGKIWIE